MSNYQHIVTLPVTSSLFTNFMKYATKTCCIQTFVLVHVLMMLRAVSCVHMAGLLFLSLKQICIANTSEYYNLILGGVWTI